MPLHPVLRAAADGRLPGWAEISAPRRAHVARVSGLMGQWAGHFGLSDADAARWRAAGLLHDSLRDADPASLRPLVGPELAELPGKMLHGPAAAARLREAGVGDEPLLLAVAWHTLGHPAFDRLGKALYLADYTESGREYASDELASRRERVPSELDVVLLEVAADRIAHALRRGHPLLDQTVGFWNRITGG